MSTRKRADPHGRRAKDTENDSRMKPTAKQRRDPYALAATAGRLAQERAFTVPLSLGAWKVLSFVIGQTALYSKLEDRLFLGVIADATGLSPRTVGRALADLDRRGIIEYEPGAGRRLSVVRLPFPSNWTPTTSTLSGRQLRPGTQSEGPKTSTLSGRQLRPGRVDALDVHRPRSSSEEVTEEERLGLRAPKPNPVWDVLSEDFGEPATRQERSLRGKCVKDFRDLGLDDDEVSDLIRRRAAEHRRRWPNVDCTPTSLLKHWTLMGRPPPELAIAEPAGYESLREIRRRVKSKLKTKRRRVAGTDDTIVSFEVER